MSKNIGDLLLKYVLIPLLRAVITAIFDRIIKYVFEKFKGLYAKWMEDDIRNAKSDEEKETIRKKYETRMRDLSDLEADIQSNVPNAINEVVDAAAKDSSKLMKEAPDSQPKQLPAKE